MFLKDNDFRNLIRTAPLVAIDLIVKNFNHEVLLGLRKYEPAKNYWFVPGGRIYKNESIDQAISRISEAELNIKPIDIDKLKLLGVYQHFYQNNFYNDPSFNTHYIVIAYELFEGISSINKSSNQHRLHKFFSVHELLNDKKVHKYTKDYFIE